MSLYDLHERPETLTGYNKRFEIPQVAWEAIVNDLKHRDPITGGSNC